MNPNRLDWIVVLACIASALSLNLPILYLALLYTYMAAPKDFNMVGDYYPGTKTSFFLIWGTGTIVATINLYDIWNSL